MKITFQKFVGLCSAYLLIFDFYLMNKKRYIIIQGTAGEKDKV